MSEENQNSKATEENSNGKTHESTFEIPDEVKKLQEQAEKFKNDYLYLRAEFDNYRKNMIKERAEYLKYGSERIILDLLTIVDNFDRALMAEVTPETIDAYKKGVEITATELKNLLSKNGVAEVPSENQDFDPTVHEALTSEVSDKVAPGKILRVFQKAYKLHDKLIRPAKVVVAKKADS